MLYGYDNVIQFYPSIIEPLNDSESIFNYNGLDSNYSGAIKTDTGTYKIVYFAFGFEGIDGFAKRDQIMGNVIEWFVPLANISITPTTKVYNQSSVDLNVSFAETSYGVNYTFDLNSQVSLCTECNFTNLQLSNLSEGVHNLTVYANNKLGISNSNSLIFAVDLSSPQVLNFSVTPMILGINSNIVFISYFEDISEVLSAQVIITNCTTKTAIKFVDMMGSENLWHATTNTFAFTNGVYCVNVSSVDIVGNSNNLQVSNFTVNSTFNGTLYSNNSLSTVNKSVNISANSGNVTIRMNFASDISNESIAVATYSTNPISTGFGVPTIGKYVQIESGNTLENNMLWSIIKIHYLDSELDATINESNLRIYYFDGANWVSFDDPIGGVNITGNYVWANTTHFSYYGVGIVLDLGNTCSHDSNCLSGHCVHSVCRSAATYCGDGYCDLGESCTSDSTSCSSGYSCTNGCVYLGGGSSGSSYSSYTSTSYTVEVEDTENTTTAIVVELPVNNSVQLINSESDEIIESLKSWWFEKRMSELLNFGNDSENPTGYLFYNTSNNSKIVAGIIGIAVIILIFLKLR